jgi:hypothetical protein
MTVSSTGAITGSGYSNIYRTTGTGTGSLSSNGGFDMALGTSGATSEGALFTGTVDASGKMQGTWKNTQDNTTGTFTGQQTEGVLTPTPTPPTGLAVTASSSSQINLSWNASTGATGYKIYKNGTYLKTVTTTSTSDTGLSPSINYCYYVIANNSAGDSVQTSQQCATTQASTGPTNVNYNNTYLLRGTWTFNYTIGTSPFSQTYVLNSMDGTPNSSGDYYINGTDAYGGSVIGMYYSATGNWNVLDTGTIIDRFFDFHTDGTNILSGSCYYQIAHPAETWSSCYPLSGNKTNLTSLSAQLVVKAVDSSAMDIEEAEKANQTVFSQPEESVKSMYLMLRSAAGK